ncbi:8-oxo-dGTP diphosphatase [Alkalithermobacter thermoalcaliphilus JW-YL-7 = DSM 7308]|uniref:8-oxo-dGTP diphosphatase n=1 Tax=Alkalithermobacter thermoalcaliphilus JW-YL-7 = DSM 7308 TaxID=1121328 RepID=A0A150FQN7_CLOPD|nr:NUDIX hydrolase [[Clostridium] paradoxum JW-YL-7 = DSM 7308]SHK54634.1 8-oxo-dGTP diphosphatase [[Clostridium] paradoxum JW-YL-7 = DSM 7308]
MFVILIKTLIFKENEVLLIKRSNSNFASYKWDLPGGKLEFKEDPIDCLKREVLEETGIDIEILDIASVDTSFEIDKIQYISLIYEAKYLKGDITLSCEHEDYIWINPKQALDMDLVYYTKNALKSHIKRKERLMI